MPSTLSQTLSREPRNSLRMSLLVSAISPQRVARTCDSDVGLASPLDEFAAPSSWAVVLCSPRPRGAVALAHGNLRRSTSSRAPVPISTLWFSLYPALLSARPAL